MVKIENFSCGYGSKVMLKDFNATFSSGQIGAIVASSGRGKSTLLKAINRLHEVEDSTFFKSGKILAKLNGNLEDIYSKDARYIREKIGYIFQEPTPLPLSIWENVDIALKINGINSSSKVIDALKRVGLYSEVKDRLHSSAQELSLGQQQRLAIARVLVLNPTILLFDEPTSSLDLQATLKIEELMQNLKKDKTIILVTHDLEQIKRVADFIINL